MHPRDTKKRVLHPDAPKSVSSLARKKVASINKNTNTANTVPLFFQRRMPTLMNPRLPKKKRLPYRNTFQGSTPVTSGHSASIASTSAKVYRSVVGYRLPRLITKVRVQNCTWLAPAFRSPKKHRILFYLNKSILMLSYKS